MRQHSRGMCLLPKFWRKSEAAQTSGGGLLMCKRSLESNSLSSRCRENISLIQFIWLVQSNNEFVQNRGTIWQTITDLLLASPRYRKAQEPYGGCRHPGERVHGRPRTLADPSCSRGSTAVCGRGLPAGTGTRRSPRSGRRGRQAEPWAPRPRGHAGMLQRALPKPASWRGPTHAGTFP